MSSRRVLHLIYKVRQAILLIVTFLSVRTPFYPTYLDRSFHFGKMEGFHFFFFLFQPHLSFRHPLVPFLRTRLKTHRPSIKWGFDGVYSTIHSSTTRRASNFASRFCTLQFVKLPDLSDRLNIFKYILPVEIGNQLFCVPRSFIIYPYSLISALGIVSVSRIITI